MSSDEIEIAVKIDDINLLETLLSPFGEVNHEFITLVSRTNRYRNSERSQ